MDLIMGQEISQIQDSLNMMGSKLNYSKKIKNLAAITLLTGCKCTAFTKTQKET